MSKFDEQEEKRHKEYIDLGIKNAEYLESAKKWCTHFRADLESAGLLAQYTGLPIGSFKISCQYADNAMGSMNLPWVIPDFIIKNCADCKYHNENGGEEWGKKIIEDHNKAKLDAERNKKEKEEKKEKIREKLKSIPEKEIAKADLTEKEICNLFIGLFSDDEDQKDESYNSIINAAEVASELFTSTLIDIMIDNIELEDYSKYFLDICCVLSKHLDIKNSEFRELAVHAIKSKVNVEVAAQLLSRSNPKLPLDTQLVNSLILHQSHQRPLGGFSGRAPTYPFSTDLLIESFKKKASSVTKPFEKLISHKKEIVRLNTAGALLLIQKQCPKIGLELIDILIDSLDFPRTLDHDNADAKIKSCVIEAFIIYPNQVHDAINKKFSLKREAVKDEIISIYRALVFRINEDNSIEDSDTIDHLIFEFCFNTIQDKSLSIDIRSTSAEALKMLASYRGQVVADKIDSILGYYALIAEIERPKTKPKIILPNQEPDSKIVSALDEQNQEIIWSGFKSNILGVIKEAIEIDPHAIFETLVRTYETLDSKKQSYFKAAIIQLLAEVGGNDYKLIKEVLPVYMKGLMDFDSTLVRYTAIENLYNLFKRSKTPPPRNITEIVVLHLRDEYVVVHKASIKCINYHVSWFDERLSLEAIYLLFQLIDLYKSKPYDLESIIEAIIKLALKLRLDKKVILTKILSYFPTREYYPDKKIVELLIDFLKPKEPGSELFAKQIVWYLANYSRDPNSYRLTVREKIFKWILESEKKLISTILADFVKAGKKVAERDIYEVSHFASVLSRFSFYRNEFELLNYAVELYKNEKIYEELIHNYNSLKSNIEINIKTAN